MVRKGYTPEQIINKLREAEVLLSQGNTISIACNDLPPVVVPALASLSELE
jgi:hypothetical protein